MNNKIVPVFLCLLLFAGCAAPQTRTQKGAVYGAAGEQRPVRWPDRP